MHRRTFLIEAGKAFTIVPGAVYLLGCGGGSSPTGPSPTPTPTPDPPTVIRVTSSVDAGHNHDASVPRADVTARVAKSYTSTADSGHTHVVTLTTANFTTIDTGAAVTVTSSTDDGHTHTFTFRK